MRPAIVVATNSYKLNHIPALIYSALTDFSHYRIWWPSASFEPLSPDQIRVKPQGVGSFTWTLHEALPHTRVVLTYSGMFEGKGTWELIQNGAYTKVIYSVELTINHPLLKWLNRIIPLATLHSTMMHKVFASLDAYLNNFHVKA